MGTPLVVTSYIQTHLLIESFLLRISNTQLHWRYTPQHHPIAFHAWHVARWADHFQAAVPGMTPELGKRLGIGTSTGTDAAIGKQFWYAEGLDVHWEMQHLQGYDSTGMHMPDEVAVALRFPEKARLVNYVQAVFRLAEKAASAIDDAQFESPEQPQPMTKGIWSAGTVGEALLSHVTHANRHLGMMECLLGLQGLSGTATQ